VAVEGVGKLVLEALHHVEAVAVGERRDLVDGRFVVMGWRHFVYMGFNEWS
jgi:hypothetical protein